MMQKFKKLNFRRQVLLITLCALAIYFLLTALINLRVINCYYSGILLSVCINVILVVSLNITTGFLGQLTLGHAGFMAVGAYVSAFITKTFVDIPDALIFPLALVVGGFVAMLIGALVCLPTLRLKGDYLAIVTLAFGEVIKTILLNLEIVGGASGYIGIPRFTNLSWAFWLMIVVILLTYSLINSRTGRAMISIREDEIASESSGIATNNYKLLAFVISAFFAGIAGGLYAHYLGILEPKIFGFDKSIEILVMVVIGGMGSLPGAIFGASIITILPEMLKGISNLRTLIYAIALIFIMLFKYDARLQVIKAKTIKLFKKGAH